MEMFERVKYFRKTILHISQNEFAKKLNISGSNLSNIEIGRIGLTDRVINEICEAYGINEEWLRTGEGPMEKQKTRDEEILSFIDKIKETDNVFAKRFIMALSKLSYDEWKTIDKLITNYSQMSALCDEETAVSENLKKPDNKLTPAEKRAIVNGELNIEEKEQIL